MARKLRSDEAQIFTDAADDDEVEGFNDTGEFLRRLLDRQNEPLELTVVPGVWLKGVPPGSPAS